ncbi:ATP synthase subunit alpha, partial [Melia azedarach]
VSRCLFPRYRHCFFSGKRSFTTRGPSTVHAALLRQAFAHCGKFPTAASRRSLGRVSVPVWLIILSDQLLIIALVLTRYSPVRHWKHHFPSDLHVLSMPPAFILSQDRTLHEIHSCITYSFLVRRQS